MGKRLLMVFWVVLLAALAFFVGFSMASGQIEVRPVVEYVYEPYPLYIDRPVYVYESSYTVKLDTDEEDTFIRIVAGEALHDGWESIVAVAEVLRNHIVAGATVYEAQRLFDGWWDGALPEYVVTLCRDVLNDRLSVIGREAKWFYSPAYMVDGWSAWHESQQFLGWVGSHKFFATTDGR